MDDVRLGFFVVFTYATLMVVGLLLLCFAVYALFRCASAAWYRSKAEWGSTNQVQEQQDGQGK